MVREGTTAARSSSSGRELDDPVAMRALTHPVRIALIEALLAGGAMTATEVGEEIGESATTCSFHLRQLAKYGFVEEAGGGRGRARPWRMTSTGVEFAGSYDDPGTQVAARTLLRLMRDRQLARYRTWLETRSAYPKSWQRAAGDVEYLSFLTADELRQLKEDLQELLASRFEKRLADPSSRPTGAVPVELLLFAYPTALRAGTGDRGGVTAGGSLLRGQLRISVRALPGPLASRNFLLLIGCDVTSLIGSGVALVAVPFAVLAVGGSASDVGYVATAALVPVIVFLLAGGVIADRLPRHRVMVAAEVVQAVAQALSAALVLTGRGTVADLLVLAAVRGTGFGFYLPAEAGLLPQTVTAGELSQANAIFRVGRNSAQIAGAALGGIAVSVVGAGYGLAIDAISFALAAALRLGMRFPASPPAHVSSMLTELRQGWHEFTSRRWLWVIVVQFAIVAAITTATLSVLGPLVAHAQPGGARSWGLTLAAYSAGSVLGGLLMIKLRPARILLAATLAVPGFSLLPFALVPPLPLAPLALSALLAGLCLQVFGVNWATTMQQEIPPAALSRVSAYDALGSFGLAPIGTAVAGPLANRLGASSVLATGGAAIIVITGAVLLVPEIRHLRRRVAGTAT